MSELPGSRGGGQPATASGGEGPCLVTGASGFIGGSLARRLASNGTAVRCLVRARSDTSRLRELGVEIAVGDLADRASLDRAAQGCRQVVHCAALVSDWATVQEILATNVHGTRALLGACAEQRVERFVHLSTTDVYGHPGTPAVRESHVGARFRNWYAQSKLDAEAEVRGAARERSLETVILRPATVYGPDCENLVGEIARAIRARHMLLVGGGRASAGLAYVENVVDAALIALRHPAAVGRAFNVSDGLEVTWRRFLDDLADGLGCPRPRLSVPYPAAAAAGVALEHAYRLLRRASGIRTRPLLSRQAVQVLGVDQAFSNASVRETLGWEPRVGYAEGMRATLRWLGGDGRPVRSDALGRTR